MDTRIGQQLRHPTWRWATALGLGVAIIATDLAMYGRSRMATDAYINISAQYGVLLMHLEAGTTSYGTVSDHYMAVQRAYDAMQRAEADAILCRALLALAAPLAYLVLARGDWVSVGLCTTPVQGWRWWSVTGCRLALLVTGAAIPIGLVWRQVGWGWDAVAGAFADNDWPLAECCVRYPVFEEMLYRLAICVPVAARFGKGPAIAASGILFAAIHVIYDALNPVNAIAGFLLAWAFFKSESITVPILLHALGNLLFWLFLWAVGPGLARLVV
jgi:uncharacterized protein